MDLADGIRTFVAVSEAGSFTAASRRLGMSNKLVSKYIAALEARLGHQLIYRTTRSLSLTEDGKRWLPHAREVLQALEAAEAALSGHADGLSGHLRITAGTTFGELCLSDPVRAFITRYPAVRVDMVLDDSFIDLAAGGFDLAVRVGLPRDSGYKMQRIGSTLPCIAASPAYLARHGTPEHPRELAEHHAILDLNEEVPGRWSFRDGQQEMVVTVTGMMAVNSASVTIQQAMAGFGLIRAPDIFLAPWLASGALIQVLSEYTAGGHPIYLLRNPSSYQQKKIIAFTEVLRQHLTRAGEQGSTAT